MATSVTLVFRNRPLVLLDNHLTVLLVGTRIGVTEYMYERKNGDIIFKDVKMYPAQFTPWEWEPEGFVQAQPLDYAEVVQAMTQRLLRESNIVSNEPIEYHEHERKNLLRKAG